MKTLPKNWQPDEYTDWYNISCYYKLSESFIRKYKDKVNWNRICVHQELSEEFIIEFKDKVHWYCISYHQKLSESFIREFKYEVHWPWISICQKHISTNFLNQYQYLISSPAAIGQRTFF